MDSFSQMHIFFLISSLGFIILFILVAVLLFYVISSVKTAKRILEKAERNIDHIGDTAKDILEDLRDSMIFRFLFGKKRKRRKE
jgi:hypothetical protein